VPEPLEPAPLDDGIEAQFVRTVPERLYDPCRHGEWSILESYLRALRAAERFVYLESQFLWAPEIVQVLSDKLREPPRADFRVVVLLPQRPNNGTDDTRGQIGVLIDADRDGPPGDRFLACTLFQPAEHGRPVYVHAKVGIVDDQWLTVGSANLNGHSFFNDSEVNAVVRDPAFVRAARLKLWSEHLDGDADGEPSAVVDERWRVCAGAKLRRLEGVSRRSQALWGPVNGLIVDG